MESIKNNSKRNIIIFIICGVLLALLTVGILLVFNKNDKIITDIKSDLVNKVSVDEWKSIVNSKKVVITVLSESNDKNEKMYKSTFEKIAKENNVDYAWFNIDELSKDDYKTLLSMFDDMENFSVPYTIVSYSGLKLLSMGGYVEEQELNNSIKQFKSIE